jgi:hypothetical protein
LRGDEFLGGEPIGTGRARRIDGGLSLLEFFVWGSAAGRSDQRRQEGER